MSRRNVLRPVGEGTHITSSLTEDDVASMKRVYAVALLKGTYEESLNKIKKLKEKASQNVLDKLQILKETTKLDDIAAAHRDFIDAASAWAPPTKEDLEAAYFECEKAHYAYWDAWKKLDYKEQQDAGGP